MTRRSLIAGIAAAVVLALAAPLAAHADVPARVRIIKGSRQGTPHVDPKLEDLRRQLSALAYVRWEQTSESRLSLARGKTEFVQLPDGDLVGLTVQEEGPALVTIEVALSSRNTQSRLTIEKGQRIVHQVTGEKGGSAFFLTVTAWP